MMYIENTPIDTRPTWKTYACDGVLTYVCVCVYRATDIAKPQPSSLCKYSCTAVAGS
jgi:hypothetical protein